MQRKYDTVLSVRVDRRDLAMAELIFRKSGYSASSKGDLVRAGLEALVKTYIERGDIEPITSTSEAMLILDKYGSLNPGGRGQRNLVINLQKESLRNEAQQDEGRRIREIEDATKQALEEFDSRAFEEKERTKLRQLDGLKDLVADDVEEEEKVSFDDV